MFGILLRPLPVLENIVNINIAFWQIMYVLLPEITYYLLVIYSLIKVSELKNYLVNKFITYALIIPNLILTLKLILYTMSDIRFFLSLFSNI